MPETDAVELDLYDLDLTTKLGTLPAVDVGLYFELNQTGSGNCKVHTLRSLASGLVQQGQFIRVNYRGAVQGGFFVEDIGKNEASQGESADLWTPIQGRGPMKMLESAMVWSDGTDASTRDFAEQPKAAMLITLIEEAKARGGLAVVDYDFTASVDSNGDAWTDAEAMQFSVGKTLLDVCREISDFGIDTNMTVNEDGTFTLQAFANGKGSDKSTTIYFRRGVNCTEITVDGRGMDFANALLLKHENGYVAVTDNDSIATHGRVEKMIDAHDAGNSDNALRYGQALLAMKKDPKKEVSMQMYDGVSPYVFTDYDTGDWVTKDISGVEEVLRVRSITLSWTDAEKADVTVGLNSLVIENEIKQQNDIRKLYEMIRRQNDGKEVTLPFWAAIGKLSNLATDGTAIYAMAVSDAGILYVGGGFSKIGGKDVGNAAAYNINTGQWSTLGTGFDDEVLAIVCDGTSVYFGGRFTDADGVTCSDSLARWNEGTEAFESISTGGSEIYPIRCLAKGDGRIYVGGTNDAPIYGGEYNCIGYLDTSDDSWHTMIGIIGETAIDANSIDVTETKVYVGMGASGNGVVLYSWDIAGETWTTLAVNYELSLNSVYAVKVYGNYLYIGGDFGKLTTPFPDLEDIPDTISIARMSLDTGIIESFEGGFTTTPDETVRAFYVSGSELIIGGTFLEIGGQAANNIAKWNDGIFTILGSGLNNTCYALTGYNGNIGAGGVFTQAGGKPIKYIGAYITSLEELVNYLETGGGAETGGGYTHPNHSGDVVSAGDGAQTIQPNVVTNSKLATMATETLKGRSSPGTGDPEDIPFADIIAMVVSAFGTALGLTGLRVVVTDSGGNLVTDDQLTFDPSTNRLEVGAGSPVMADNSFAQSADGASTGHLLTSWGTGFASYVRGIFARGTKASPTAAQLDDILFRLRGSAHDGTTWGNSNAEIRFIADENHVAGSHGSRFEFWITPTGSTTLTKALTIQSDGNINIETGKEYRINGVPVGGGGTNSIQIDCSGGTSDTYGVLSGSINGSNKVFTVSLGSYISGGLQVYLNGQLMTQGTGEDWTETTPASGTFTMTNAPVAGDVLLIVYKHSTSVSGNADTVDGYEAETLLNNPRIGRNTVEVDFETGDLYKVATVNDALCTSTSIIVATVLAKATDNSTADDIMVQPFEVQIKNQTTGFFDIVVKSLIGKAIHEVPVSYILMN